MRISSIATLDSTRTGLDVPDESDPTVLIVDDDPQVRSLFGLFLEDEYETKLAESGQAALKMMGPDIDVVLLDRRMPDVDGDEVLRHFRDQELTQPVAMVTAIEPEFDIVDMGFDDYVVKPVDGEELREVVATMLLREEYDDVIREYFSLVSMVTLLEQKKAPPDLEESDEYAKLCRELDEIKDEARTALDMAMQQGKFDELFRDLPADDAI